MSKSSLTLPDVELSPLLKRLVEAEVRSQGAPRTPHVPVMGVLPAPGEMEYAASVAADVQRGGGGETSLVKSILSVLNGGAPGDQPSIERLAFETDPTLNTSYAGLYHQKLRLIPDVILKRIAIQDDLIASIVNARSNQIAAFGRSLINRFDDGFVIEPKHGTIEDMAGAEKEKLQERIDRATELLLTCGHTKGWDDNKKMNFSQFLYMTTRNALIVGRSATEIVYQIDDQTQEKVWHSFRPIDAGTIYRAAPHSDDGSAEQLREQAIKLLAELNNKKIDPKKFQEKDDPYCWVQVIEGRPVQAFTSKECVVHNFFPVTDVELDGYPLTPIDTMIAAVTTHINITSHNKLYFQSGRASRGMLVIKSDDANEKVVQRVKQQFMASINGVANSWRMPVFAVGQDDDITWSPIDQGGRDAEFQYLSDTNARVILSAYAMSPEELPGYAHLSRGTNNQALSESNNEYKLEAARDVGIRPLLRQFEDFINATLLPLIDPFVAKYCKLRLVGLDSDTPEKESTRLQQDMVIHLTMDEILEKVEKDPIGAEMGGEFLLNQAWQAVVDKYVPVGKIVEKFFGVPGASKDPQLAYYRDPFWMQWQQLMMQAQQSQQQAQQGAGGAPGGGGGDSSGGGAGGGGDGDSAGGGGGGGGGGDGSAGASQGSSVQGSANPSPSGSGSPGAAMTQNQQAAQGGDAGGSDLTRSIDQVLGLLTKSEQQLPPSRRRLLAQQRKAVSSIMDDWELQKRKMFDEVLAVAEQHLPTTEE